VWGYRLVGRSEGVIFIRQPLTAYARFRRLRRLRRGLRIAQGRQRGNVNGTATNGVSADVAVGEY
jgi:hypothetical protein